MVAAAINYLGIGMYTPAEAAMYARVSTRVISRWVHGAANSEPAIRAEKPGVADKTVTFLDLVQTMALRAIREQRERVSLQKIRQAVKYVEDMGIAYPFARQHITYFTLGDDIQIEVKGHGLIQASGDQRGQFTMKPIVEEYLCDLRFNQQGLADEYVAVETPTIRIVLKPGVRFGEPVVEPSGYSAWSLWEAVLSEGGVAAAAKAYGVDEAEVRVAYKYIYSIRPATAA